jgi:orotidine-5'-phosphate decarboxylase
MVTDLVPEEQGSGFASRLRLRAHDIQSWLCVGLDPDPARLPLGIASNASGLLQFCRQVVEATTHRAVCFKINSAFFEAYGAHGWSALESLRAYIDSSVPLIIDAKRGDLGNTSIAYARALFDTLGADAATVNPYLGWDSLEPFLERAGRGVFILCKTSNPGAADFQDLRVGGEPLYMRIAREAVGRNAPADIGLVIGATQPDALRKVRALSSETVFLAPGVGAQGAHAEEAIRTGANEAGDNLLASVSRDILYASRDLDFAAAAARKAETLARETWHSEENAAANR